MKSVELMYIIEQLMEMNCPALNIDQKYMFIYRDYVIKLNTYNIWIGDNCYSYPQYNIGHDFFDKVCKYSRKSVDIDKLKSMVERDCRKQKLERIGNE